MGMGEGFQLWEKKLNMPISDYKKANFVFLDIFPNPYAFWVQPLLYEKQSKKKSGWNVIRHKCCLSCFITFLYDSAYSEWT